MQKEALNYVSKRMLVPQDFKEIFSHFYFSQNNTKKPIVKTLLPNFNIIMVFSLVLQYSLNQMIILPYA